MVWMAPKSSLNFLISLGTGKSCCSQSFSLSDKKNCLCPQRLEEELMDPLEEDLWTKAMIAGGARSVGCAVRLVFRRLRVQSYGPAPSFFYSHSLPFADSSRAVVSYWQKYWLTA